VHVDVAFPPWKLRETEFLQGREQVKFLASRFKALKGQMSLLSASLAEMFAVCPASPEINTANSMHFSGFANCT
jgi:hypothetical protein